jgi:hypothetical protein
MTQQPSRAATKGLFALPGEKRVSETAQETPTKRTDYQFTVIQQVDYNGDRYFVALPTANVSSDGTTALIDPCGIGLSPAQAMRALFEVLQGGAE